MGFVMGMTRRFITTFSRTAKISAAAFSATVLVAVGLPAVPAAAVTPGCGPEANAIVCENSKPGTSFEEWDIDGAGDDSIQGFATDISVNVGQRVDFKIDTDANAYTIDIYRTGWYQGLGARKITSVQPSAQLPQHQPECLSDVTTELMDCGTWAVSASWNVPADAVSGVYLAKLTRTDTGGSSHITFIVRNEASTSDVLVQTSDPTWHAYNLYGGSDFYSGAANGRAFKISYNRPFATRAGLEARDFYFGAEYPLVRFLERNGYDVSYFSGVDTDRHGELLKNHKTFISMGHDEYWSGPQRSNVEAARDAGVNLQFLTGNEIYWRTRYEPSSTGGNDYRTLVSYKETWSNSKIDPSAEWTGTWRDPRFASPENGAGLPENSLTGTAYVVNNGDLPVTVNDEEGKRRIWRDTSLTSMAAGTRTELAPHTVGYESNEDLPNGFRPPGLIHLSTTTGSVPEYLQDFGNQVAAGETTHHTTMYKAESGALVFSAGSVRWTWGLDEWHDGDGADADPRMQQAQVNLLADMDALPTTLMSELVMPTAAKDTLAPSLNVTNAPTGTVKNGEEITVSGTASDTGGVVAAVEYSLDGGSTWNAAEGSTNWTFSTIQKGNGETDLLVRAIDDSANYPENPTAVPLDVSGPYSVFGNTIPSVPDSGDGSAVELGLRITAQSDGYITGVRFYKSPANTGTHTGSLWSLDGTQLATVTFSKESGEGWQTASFAEPIEVKAGDEYVVSYFAPNGHYAVQTQGFAYRGENANPITVAGGFGTAPAGLYVSNAGFPSHDYDRSNYYVDALFETGESIDLAAYGQNPADTAVSVSTATGISGTLSKPVIAESVEFQIKDRDGNTVAGSTSYDESTREAVFTPEAPLSRGMTYVVTLGATDLSGNKITRGGTWTFRTMYPDPTNPNACPCGLFQDSELPDIPSASDGTPATLGTRFSSTVEGTVTGIEFYRSPGETGEHTGWLYSAAGDKLGEVTFPDDSVSGWQYAEFDSPVTIEPTTQYVVAYRSNGTYPITAGGLANGLISGPLRTEANAGQYSYESGYPSNTVSTNYLVDVRFEEADPPVSITGQTPASNALDVPADTPVSVTFSEAVQSGATLEMSNAAGPVEGTSTLSNDGKTLQFLPDAPLKEATVFTVKAKNIVGMTTGTTSFDPWKFRTTGDSGALNSFLGDQEPAQTDPADNASVELGMRLSTARDIEIQALRYYQGPLGAGAHTGSIWSSSGERLATVPFTASGSQGWHLAFLEEPLRITAGSTFTVSYQAPSGGYVYSPADFSGGKTNGVLSLNGENGVFTYGSNKSPASSWDSTNYFADLLYQVTGEPAEPSETPTPTETPEPNPFSIVGRTPSDQASGVAADTPISVTFDQAVDEGSTLVATTGSGTVAGAVERSADRMTLTLVPDEPLAAGAIVTVTPTGIVGPAGGPATFGAWKFRVAETADDPSTCPCGLFTNTDVPTAGSVQENRPVTLGTRFSSDIAGEMVGLEFYRAVGETGEHTGRLYSASGEILAEVTMPDTGVSGWQHADFDKPVPIAKDTEYVVAYRSNGSYVVSPGALAGERQVGRLKTPASAGQFSYADEFPRNQISSSYLVDVRFNPGPEPVSIVTRSPEPNSSVAGLQSNISVSFSDPVASEARLEVSSAGTAIDGQVSLDSAGTTLTFQPTASLPEGTVLTVQPTGITGVNSGSVDFEPWVLLTPGVLSFLGDQVPEQLDPDDDAAVKLGMRMRADEDLTIHALRYYRGLAGSGASKGNIWDGSGSLLASIDFGASTGPGWHTAHLDTPLRVSAGTDFTVSYFAPNGGYVYTPADFEAGKTGDALSLTGSNGVFGYGSNAMPRVSWNSTNYFADLLYTVDASAAARDSAAPGKVAGEDRIEPDAEQPAVSGAPRSHDGGRDSSPPSATPTDSGPGDGNTGTSGENSGSGDAPKDNSSAAARPPVNEGAAATSDPDPDGSGK